ncbi:SDR family oxidoreductase [Leucobacter weissii]|uniref:SDR family oxidoreductase n=1 Tax=Leucobacter weissii TaxID=1983706 RepID=A0A939MIN1_9MICO|nr:SDR family NAD(P)-dependent oxidoreductase [Leucobacter weissii]MBO1901433.1 SDR family oxidoreductase [Leucobacter weissii]
MSEENSRGSQTLEGRVAIVTGGGNGMGECTAATLAARGAQVVILDPDVENARRVVDHIVENGGRAEFHPTDVTDEEAIRDAIDRIVSRHGRIDVLDNNAAVLSLTRGDGTVLDTSHDLFMRSLGANLGGPFLMSKHVIPVMLRSGGGSIVNIASLSGILGELNLTAYGVTKAGVLQLTRAIATQFGGKGIRCNAVAPSYVTTSNNRNYSPQEVADAYLRNTPSGELVAPQDVAEAVAFLASDAARQINGHVIPVDGGLVAASPVTPDYRDAMGL